MCSSDLEDVLAVCDRRAEGEGVMDDPDDVARQSLLTHAAMKLRSPERADLWMRSALPFLGGRKPRDVCVEKGGLERCKRLLK